MTARLLSSTVACLALAGAAAGANGSTLSARDSGKTFTLRRGHELTLRLTDSYSWSKPQVRGRSIGLIPVDYIRDPGFQEWTITTHALGTSRVTSVEPAARARHAASGSRSSFAEARNRRAAAHQNRLTTL